MIDGSDLEASLGLLEDALKASEGKVSPEARARLLSSLGRVYMRLSRYAEGAAAADQALALAEPLRLDDVVAEAMVNRASSISGVGRIREAVALMRRHELTHLVTNDDDFDRVAGLTIWKPR